ncbi:hypothetical protein JXJ21_09850 [candidate division KSB1 bacterium]|nr:hypothetical protein [candidate division KSB1 bacterium]
MNFASLKGIVFALLILACIIFSCSEGTNEKNAKSFCPYDVNDHLEYWNYGEVIHSDGFRGENEAHIIYEVVDIRKVPEGTRVQFKNYYSDTTGVVEEFDLYFLYAKDRIYLYRYDGSVDSLKFRLDENRVGTLEDYTDSLGCRHVVQVAENNATVQTRKGRLFSGCLKLVETIKEPGTSATDFIFHKISYYKDTILIKYMSVNRMEEDKGIRELRTESELEDYNVFAWR